MSIQHLIDDALLSYGYRAFPVVENDEVRGLISIADLKELPAAERDSTTVEQRMLPIGDAVVVAPETPLTDALRKLPLAPGGRLLVMRGERLVGLLTKSSLGRFVDIRRVLDASPRAPRARPDVAASPQHV
jgi:CBS domain-containing protein